MEFENEIIKNIQYYFNYEIINNITEYVSKINISLLIVFTIIFLMYYNVYFIKNSLNESIKKTQTQIFIIIVSFFICLCFKFFLKLKRPFQINKELMNNEFKNSYGYDIGIGYSCPSSIITTVTVIMLEYCKTLRKKYILYIIFIILIFTKLYLALHFLSHIIFSIILGIGIFAIVNS